MRLVGELSIRTRARSARPAARRPATLRPARAPARTAPDASRARLTVPACAHDVTARIDHERVRREQRLHVVEQRAVAPRRRRSAARPARSARANALSTSATSAGMRASRAARSARDERRARRLRSQAPHRDSGDDQFVRGSRGGRQTAPDRARRACARPRRGGRCSSSRRTRDSARARR